MNQEKQLEFPFVNEQELRESNAPRVELIHFTGKGTPNESMAAVDLLLFTKSTRLNLTPSLVEEIKNWPHDKKMAELRYMANTIPSSWEFVDYIFLVSNVSRAYTHQQVRTRAASYAQQTLRMLDASEFKYIYTDQDLKHPDRRSIIDGAVSTIRAAYQNLIDMGHRPEDARGILPTNVGTNIVCKFNMRTFTELAKSRLGGRTQSEYIMVVKAMVDAVLEVHPWMDMFLFGDKGRDFYADIEAFAKKQFPDDLATRAELLKIVHKMREADK